MDTDVTRLASTNPKKHRKTPLLPPSPPLTKSKAVARVALSLGMSNPNPCSASITCTSSHKGNTMGPQ